MDRFNINITDQYAGLTVKRVMAMAGHCAHSYISSLKFVNNGILLNGAQARTNEIVKNGDILSFQISDANPQNISEPMPFPLNFIYEDNYLACLNKPIDMVVHGSHLGGKCAVANAVAWQWGSNCAFHPVNRLDRDTSGVMLIAKSGYVHDRLRNMLHTGSFDRHYLAIVHGEIEVENGEIALPLLKGSDNTMLVSSKGLEAKTEFKVLSKQSGFSLVNVRLLTGRMHQIRAHFSAIGHPLIGDIKYGGYSDLISRPALHSNNILLTHPITEERLDLTAPVPGDIQLLMKRLAL